MCTQRTAQARDSPTRCRQVVARVRQCGVAGGVAGQLSLVLVITANDGRLDTLCAQPCDQMAGSHPSELPAGGGALVSWPDPVAGSSAAGAALLAGGGAAALLGGVSPTPARAGVRPRAFGWSAMATGERFGSQPGIAAGGHLVGHRGRRIGGARGTGRARGAWRPSGTRSWAGMWEKRLPGIWRRPTPAVGVVELGGDGVGGWGKPMQAPGIPAARLWRLRESRAVEMGIVWGRAGAWWRWPRRRGGCRAGPSPGTEVTGWLCIARPLRRLPARVAPMSGGDCRSLWKDIFASLWMRIYVVLWIDIFASRWVRIYLAGLLAMYRALFGAVGIRVGGGHRSVAAGVEGIGRSEQRRRGQRLGRRGAWRVGRPATCGPGLRCCFEWLLSGAETEN